MAPKGCTWRRLPQGFGLPGATAHRRFTT
nr:hypothetical protein [Streptomyces sp. E5N91]